MRRLILIGLLLAPAVPAADDRPARPLKDKKLERRINKAIERGVAFLKKVQSSDGSWRFGDSKVLRTRDGGLTALALYALAASGVPRSDPYVGRGVTWTGEHHKPFGTDAAYGTYSASLLVLALTRIDAVKHRARIHRLADTIIRAQQKSDRWGYQLRGYSNARRARRGPVPFMASGDNSNSQFAILALWAAYSLADYEVPRKTWERIRDHYRKTQLPSGEWNYMPGRATRQGRPSMTAAGLVATIYAVAALEGNEKVARDEPAAKRGLQALLGGPRNYRDYYFAYAMERAGTVADIPLKDWYIPGARVLVDDQKKDGSWGPPGHGDPGLVYSTSLALLFLSRTTLPPRRAAKTARETFPDLTQPGQLARAFDFYAAYKPEQRAKVLAEFGKAGPAAVGLFIEKLQDKRPATRAAAWELLGKLVDKRFLFDPGAPLEEREVMIVPIEGFWKRDGAALRWNTETRRFAVSR